MKQIAIYGAGGFGREIACLLRLINEKEPTWEFIGFFDDGKAAGTMTDYGPVLGGLSAVNDWDSSLSLVVAIGSPRVVRLITDRISNPLIDYPNIIAPDVFFADPSSVTLGRGNIFQRRCTVSCAVTLGDFNVMNGSVVFGHDASVGSYNAFMPAVRISGEVRIGDANFFGVNSCVLQQLRVGNEVKLGAGSVLMTRPKDSSLYIGVPAKLFKY